MPESSRIYIAGKVSKRAARMAIERDAKRPGKGRRIEPWLMNAHQRRTELQALAQYRHRNGLAMGSDAGWANAVGNMCRVLRGHLTVEMVLEEWGAYGVPALAQEVVEDAVKHLAGKAWGAPTLYAPAHVGSLLDLTSVERAEAGITKIDACDESKVERRRRTDRERKASKRAAQAALAPKPETKKQMAARLGISRMQLDRWIKAGKV